MIKKIVLVVAILSLAACGGARVKTFMGLPLIPERTHLEWVKQTVFVGDPMTTSSPLITMETCNLKNKITSSTSHRNKPRELAASPGLYTLIRENAEGKFYESADGLFKLNGRAAAGGLFLANQASTHSALYWSAPSSGLSSYQPMSMYIADLDVAPEVMITKSKQPPNDFKGFAAILTYTGVAGGQIKFAYREFIDGFARAAFTQEVSLDYVVGKTYSYKSARFVVHEATTSEVTFTLLQSL